MIAQAPRADFSDRPFYFSPNSTRAALNAVVKSCGCSAVATRQRRETSDDESRSSCSDALERTFPSRMSGGAFCDGLDCLAKSSAVSKTSSALR